jgi:hypothetical protein
MKKRSLAGIIILIIIAAVVIGLLIQLIPLPGRGHNPPVVQDVKWDTPQTASLVHRACYDCHSNETVWPWYSYVAPVSWLVYRDVTEGRRRLNFSDANNIYISASQIVHNIQEGEMPPGTYLLMHPTARLTDTEKQQLIQGIQNSIH